MPSFLQDRKRSSTGLNAAPQRRVRHRSRMHGKASLDLHQSCRHPSKYLCPPMAEWVGSTDSVLARQHQSTKAAEQQDTARAKQQIRAKTHYASAARNTGAEDSKTTSTDADQQFQSWLHHELFTKPRLDTETGHAEAHRNSPMLKCLTHNRRCSFPTQ